MTKKQLFEMGLFAICDAIHASSTGSSDPLPPETKNAYVNYLKYRVSVWRPSHRFSQEYDDCVYHLVKTTLSIDA